MEIRSLPKDVVTSIRSKSSLSTFAQCVVELTSNALDAESTSIAIRINLNTFTIQIVDNGIGINENNLRAVGVSYMTSKCTSLEDFESNLKYLGYRGEALANLRKISEKLTIVSRARDTEATCSKIFNKAKSSTVCRLETKRPLSGTTVIAEGIFYKCPVRQQRIDSCFEIEEIRREIERIAILNHHVSFTVRDNCDKKIIFKTQKSESILSALSLLYNEDITRQFKPVCYKRGRFEIAGYISCTARQNKNIQFVYVNRRPVQRTKIHKLAKYMFDRSSIIKDNNNTKNIINKIPDFFVEPQYRSKHSGFVLCIRCPYSEYDITFDVKKTLIEFKDNNKVLLYVRTCLQKFMKKENLIAENTEDKKSDTACYRIRRKDISVSLMKNTVRGFAVKQNKLIEKNKKQNKLNEERTVVKKKRIECNGSPKNNDMDENRCLVKKIIYKDIEVESKKTENKKNVKHIDRDTETDNVLTTENEQMCIESSDNENAIKRPKPELWVLERNDSKRPKQDSWTTDQCQKTFKSDSLQPFSLVKHIECDAKQEEIELDKHELLQIEKELTEWRKSDRHKRILDWIGNCPSDIKQMCQEFKEDTDVIEIKSISKKSMKITKVIHTPFNKREEVNYYKTFFSHKKIRVVTSRMSREKCKGIQKNTAKVPKKVSTRQEIRRDKGKKSPDTFKTYNENSQRSEKLFRLKKNERMTDEARVDTVFTDFDRTFVKHDNMFHLNKKISNINETNAYSRDLNMNLDQDVAQNNNELNKTEEANELNRKSFHTAHLKVNDGRNVSKELNSKKRNSCPRRILKLKESRNALNRIKNKNSCDGKSAISPKKRYRSKNTFDFRLRPDFRVQNKIIHNKNSSCERRTNKICKISHKREKNPKMALNYVTTKRENINDCITVDTDICKFEKSTDQLYGIHNKIMKNSNDFIDSNIKLDQINMENDAKRVNNENVFDVKPAEYRKPNTDSDEIKPNEFVFDSRKYFYSDDKSNFNFNSTNTDGIQYTMDTNKIYFNKTTPGSIDKRACFGYGIDFQVQSGFQFQNGFVEDHREFSDPKKYSTINNMDDYCNYQYFNELKDSVYPESSKFHFGPELKLNKNQKQRPLYITPNDFLVSAFDMSEQTYFNSNYDNFEGMKEFRLGKNSNHNNSGIFKFNHFISEERVGEQFNCYPSMMDYSKFTNEEIQKFMNDEGLNYNNFRTDLKNNNEFDLEHALRQNVDNFSNFNVDGFRNRTHNFERLSANKSIHGKTDCKTVNQSIKLPKRDDLDILSPFNSVQKFRTSTNGSKISKDLLKYQFKSNFHVHNAEIVSTAPSEHLKTNNINYPTDLWKNNDRNVEKLKFLKGSETEFQLRPNFRFLNTNAIPEDFTECLNRPKNIKLNKKTQSTQTMLKDKSTSPMKRWHSFFDSYEIQNSASDLKNKTANDADSIKKNVSESNAFTTSHFFYKNKTVISQNSHISLSEEQKNHEVDSKNMSIVIVDETSIENSDKKNCENCYISTSSPDRKRSEGKVLVIHSQDSKHDTTNTLNIDKSKKSNLNCTHFKYLSPLIHVSKQNTGRFHNQKSNIYMNSSNLKGAFDENINISNDPITFTTNTTDSFFNEAVVNIISRIKTDSSDINSNEIDKEICAEETVLQISQYNDELIFDFNKELDKKRHSQSSNKSKSIFLNSLSNENLYKINVRSQKCEHHKRNEINNIKLTENTDSCIKIDDNFDSENKESNETNVKITDVYSNHENWMVERDINGRPVFVNKINGMSVYELPDMLNDTFTSRKRLDFLPKGMSQMFDARLQRIDVKELTPDAKKEIQEKIYNSNLTEDDLLTVKWNYAPKTVQKNEDRLKSLFSKFDNISEVKNVSGLHTYKFTNKLFQKLRIVNQLDNKFIVTVLKNQENESVILFDQHAVDERIRLEQLLSEYKDKDTFKTTELKKPINLTVLKCNSSILTKQQKKFKEIGLVYEVIDSNIIKVTSVPTCLYKKDVRDKKQKNESFLLVSLESLIHEYVASLVDTKGVKCTPHTLLNVINSEACRGAIKFGNFLPVDKCKKLINQLSDCELPFQCAHGRPTLFPVIDIPTNTDIQSVIKIKFEKLLKNI